MAMEKETKEKFWRHWGVIHGDSWVKSLPRWKVSQCKDPKAGTRLAIWGNWRWLVWLEQWRDKIRQVTQIVVRSLVPSWRKMGNHCSISSCQVRPSHLDFKSSTCCVEIDCKEWVYSGVQSAGEGSNPGCVEKDTKVPWPKHWKNGVVIHWNGAKVAGETGLGGR